MWGQPHEPGTDLIQLNLDGHVDERTNPEYTTDGFRPVCRALGRVGDGQAHRTIRRWRRRPRLVSPDSLREAEFHAPPAPKAGWGVLLGAGGVGAYGQRPRAAGRRSSI